MFEAASVLPERAEDRPLPAGKVDAVFLSVIAPCLNEAINISALVRRTITTFERMGVAGEIIVVDDASTDDTASVCAALVQEFSAQFRVIHNPENLGVFQSLIQGVRQARGRYVALIDGDLQIPPEQLRHLCSAIRRDGVDFSHGVRRQVSSTACPLGWRGNIISTLYALRWRFRSGDITSGFCMATQEVMLDILASLPSTLSYPQALLRVCAQRRGYAVREVETLFEPRRAGKSVFEKATLKVFGLQLLDFVRASFYSALSRQGNDLITFLAQHKPTQEPPGYSGWRKLLINAFFATMPLHKWVISRRAKGLFFALRRFQYLSPEIVRKYQLIKLRQLVTHAYNHVPYYRDAFDKAGIRPEDIQSLDDLARLPMLSKQDVRDNMFFEIFSDNHNKSEILRIQTSGSTGEPFTVFADRYQLEMRFATTLRGMEWAGWRWGDRQVRLWHQTLGMSWSQVVREYLDALFMRRKFIPAFEMNEKNIAAAFDVIRKHRPKVVDGYAESFNLLAYYLRNICNQDDVFSSVKGVISSAQVMPDQVRATIEDVFKTAVFDKYGSREFSGIAYEDDGHDGHVINAESYIVEILKGGRPAQPGEVGEVVITDLNNYCLPLIRYRIGDLAEALDNSSLTKSGKGLPRIGTIQGRSQALVLCRNGTWLPGTFFAHFFKDHDNLIRHYQVVQETRERIVLRLVKGPQYSAEAVASLVDALKKYVGEDMDISVDLVDEIPLVRTGKRTAVISHIKIDFQQL